jgi:hypothetical protein
VLTYFEIFLLILTIVAIYRQAYLGGRWWWPLLVILGAMLAAYAFGLMLPWLVPLFVGPARASLHPEIYMASIRDLVMAVELTMLLMLAQMSLIPQAFSERPGRYIWRDLGAGFLLLLIFSFVI